MGQSARLTNNEVRDILKKVAALGWSARQNGAASYMLYPVDGEPMPLRHSVSGKFLTYAQLRERGVEVDPKRLSQQARKPKGDRGNPLRVPPKTEWDKYAQPSMAHECRLGRPLPTGYVPSHWAKSFRFTHHANTRKDERNFHEWEIYAALDQQDFAYEKATDGRPVRCFVRGDLIVVADVPHRRIVTVVNTNGHNPSVPRVMYAPVPTEITVSPFSTAEPSTPPEENAPNDAAPTPSWKDRELPAAYRVRLYLADQEGRDVPSAELVEKLGISSQRIDAITSRLNNSELIDRTDKGVYRPVDIEALRRTPEANPAFKVKSAVTQPGAQTEDLGEAPTARTRVLAVLRRLPLSEIFTVKWLHGEIGEANVTSSNLYAILRDLVLKGHLVDLGPSLNNVNQYRLAHEIVSLDDFVARTPAFTKDAVMTATGLSVHGLAAMLDAYSFLRAVAPNRWINTTLTPADQSAPDDEPAYDDPDEDQPQPAPEPLAPEPAVEPEPNPLEPGPLAVTRFPSTTVPRLNNNADLEVDEPAMMVPPPRRPVITVELPDDSFVEPEPVAFGFEFMELPDESVFPAAATITRRKPDLLAHRGDWARIVAYDQKPGEENVEDTARKHASKVAAHLNDPTLQFAVRHISETQVGVFVRVRP